MVWDEDKAAQRCTRMWFRLGRAMESVAMDQAAKGYQMSALEAARIADVCFWQATGIDGSISMSDVLPTQGPRS